MLNILKKKQKIFYSKSLNNHSNKKQNNCIIKDETDNNKTDNKEYKNIIYYPSSSKQWLSSVYSYNKSYIKSLISIDFLVNNLFRSYFNMLENKIKLPFKRKRHNKTRYSANKIYISRAELKHTNKKLTILLYVYNKQKSSIERYIRKILIVKFTIEFLVEKGLKKIRIFKNRMLYVLKRKYFHFKILKNVFFLISNNLLKDTFLKTRHLKFHNIKLHSNILLKKHSKLEQIFINSAKWINFNKSKFNNVLLFFKGLGLTSFLEKIYHKKVKIQLVELKSIHLNSDVFSAAVALKLRDRKNKAVRLLRKAILQMVKTPDLHTLITFDDNMESMNKNNILNTIKQQVVSGVRFEASGRLTRRLTAMRAVFKYRYTGSLKNIRSSLNEKASTMLRGHVKSNLQYTVINSKTRNGTFALKCWVSSHLLPLKSGIAFNKIIRGIFINILNNLYKNIKNYIINIIIKKLNPLFRSINIKYPFLNKLTRYIINIFNKINIIIINSFIIIIIFLKKYPTIYYIIIRLYEEYLNLLNHKVTKSNLVILLLIGLFIPLLDIEYYSDIYSFFKMEYYFLLVFMFCSNCFLYNNIKNNKIFFEKYPYFSNCIILILNMIHYYLLYSIFDFTFINIIKPMYYKLIDYILKMQGYSGENLGNTPTNPPSGGGSTPPSNDAIIGGDNRSKENKDSLLDRINALLAKSKENFNKHDIDVIHKEEEKLFNKISEYKTIKQERSTQIRGIGNNFLNKYEMLLSKFARQDQTNKINSIQFEQDNGTIENIWHVEKININRELNRYKAIAAIYDKDSSLRKMLKKNQELNSSFNPEFKEFKEVQSTYFKDMNKYLDEQIEHSNKVLDLVKKLGDNSKNYSKPFVIS